MREHFAQEIESIHQDVLRMAVLVEENILKARKALVEQDSKLAKDVISSDEKVNDLELAGFLGLAR